MTIPTEKTIYGAKLRGVTVIRIKEYYTNAKINARRSKHQYIMSVSYLGGAKRGVVFLLTETGYIVGKYYEYSVKSKKYKLIKQTGLIDSAEVLFDQFENDYKISPHLQSVDFDVYSCGAWISKRFSKIHPTKTHSTIVKQFIEDREKLDYNEKLKQQLGRRDDPIEKVIGIFHEWKKFVDMCVDIRHNSLLKELDSKKRNRKTKRFSCLEDEMTPEDVYNKAVDELVSIQSELNKGCNQFRIVEIKNKLPELQHILSQKDNVDKYIENCIKNNKPIEEEKEVEEI